MRIDEHGRSLTDYPRPSVAVDIAVLTVPVGHPLSVLVVRDPRTTGYRLPGTFLHEGERLVDAVVRALHDKAGIRGIEPHQLRVFDDPQRDDRGWVLSVAHVVAVPEDRLSRIPGPADRLADAHPRTAPSEPAPPVLRAAGGRDIALVPVDEALGLDFDHDEIVRAAVAHMQREYRARPDPFRLLPRSFTLRELQLAHEAVAGHPLPKDAFRRSMEPRLRATGSLSSGTVGKPAREFRHGPVDPARRR